MTTPDTTTAPSQDGELLFLHDRNHGRTGMITRWSELTPRQRAAYRQAAGRPGHGYLLPTDRVVDAPAHTTG